MIKRSRAEEALKWVYNDRLTKNSDLPIDEDYFNGSMDRWGLVISELSRSTEEGRMLDIGAYDGIICCALQKLGFSVAAVDWYAHMDLSAWNRLGIEWHSLNIEADPLPFPDNEFSGVYMGQILEHFTYSPRKPFNEIFRVMKPGGIIVVDVPNIGELHNYYRLLRGKNVLYDYKKHYIDDEPIFYKGLPYFNRHNHEFTPTDLKALAETCGFEVVKISYIRSIRSGKKGFRRLEVPFSALRDVVPLFRKTLMMTARKPYA